MYVVNKLIWQPKLNTMVSIFPFRTNTFCVYKSKCDALHVFCLKHVVKHKC